MYMYIKNIFKSRGKLKNSLLREKSAKEGTIKGKNARYMYVVYEMAILKNLGYIFLSSC